MKKTILALCTVFSVLIFSTSTAHAVCDHEFTDHVTTGGHYEDLGYHYYVYGHNEYGDPIYRNDCMLRKPVRHCIKVCHKCGQQDHSSGHTHDEDLVHSKEHN